MKYLIEAIEIHKSGNFERAEKLYYNALQFTENNKQKSEIYRLIGILNVQKKNFVKAEEFFLKSLKENNNNPMTLNELGLLYQSTKKYDLSIKYFEINIKSNNYIDSFINLLNILIEQKNYKAVLQKIEDEKKTAFVSNQDVRNLYALALYENGKPQQAIKIFEELITEKSVKKDVYYNYSLLTYKLGLHQKSLSAINNYIFIFKKDERSLLQRHKIYKMLKFQSKAEADLLELYEKFDFEIGTKKAIIEFYQTTEKYDKAIFFLWSIYWKRKK